MYSIDETTLKYIILLFLWIEFVWELYLSIRQYNVVVNTKVLPPELKNTMNEETFNKARVYTLAKSKFGFVKDTFSIIISTVIIHQYLLAEFWQMSVRINPYPGEIVTSCFWLIIISTLSTILDLPFTIYYTFVLEEDFGFNKQTGRFFAWDKIKGYILTQVFSIVIASIIILIVKHGGEYFFIWLWFAISVVTLVLLTIYPSVIAPLFDKYTPLPEGQLRTDIENLASECKFPLTQLYVVEGSKRSAHSNAYYYGLFNSKRIVLFDTLLAKEDGSGGCKNDEIVAVLSHELGHWKYNHVVKNIIIFQINLFLCFAVFSYMFKYPPLYKALGFYDSQPVLAGLLGVIQYVLMPYNTILSFLMTCMSRRFEFQADGFATKLGKANALKRALVQLNKDNLSFPVYDNLYSAWHHSHPPLLERIEALKTSNKED